MSAAAPLCEISAEVLEQALAVLRAGGLVGLPTETVYGLAADADQPEAVARIYQVKGRPAGHPLIVHLAGAAQLADWARDIPEAAFLLARAFWPGPLTLVLKRAPRVIDAVTGGQDTVALRVPSHPVAQQVLAAFGGGLAAPSANRFGRISPTCAAHVREDLGDAVDLILEGGTCEVGLESTIVDLSGEAPAILRPGRISALEIEAVLAQAPAEGGPAAPRVPGSAQSHYAPRAALKLVPRVRFSEELARHRGQRVAVLALEISVPRVAAAVTRILPASATLYGRQLYASLRALDALGADLILVETPPAGPQWLAVRDRLARAAHEHATGSRSERHALPWKGDTRRRAGAAAPAADAEPGEDSAPLPLPEPDPAAAPPAPSA